MAGARSAWAGPITLGLASFNVKAYPLLASASKDRVRNVCACHGLPVNQPKVCSDSRKELSDDQMRKGVERSKGVWATVDANALDAASGPKSPAIAPQRVVHATSVPFHLTMSAWRLVPEQGHEAGVDGLVRVLEASGKALEMPGFTVRNGSPDTVLVVYARDGELLASMIADAAKLNTAPAANGTLTPMPDALLAMLKQLLDTMPGGDFDVTAFHSEHATKRAAAIAAAIAGTAVSATPSAAPAAPAVPDLMAALEASLAAAANTTKEPIAA